MDNQLVTTTQSLSRSEDLIYRPDIDGLRAIAVLGVVFYHAGLAFIPGGFIGVDIFFVISGFLITSILIKQKKSLSLKSFYLRRIRRIVPAFLVMLIFVYIFGYFLYTPWDLEEFSKTAKFSLLSISNHIFNQISGDYFSPGVDDMSLLHTWSLAVEEQFYLLFPLVLWLAFRMQMAVRKILILLSIITLLSFGLCIGKIRIEPSDCFYLMPYRAWELLLGSILAFHVPLLNYVKANIVGMLGLVMVMLSMFLYNKSTVFPGFAALLPCFGTVLLIIGGQHPTSWTRRLLSIKPLVWIGLISYSLYLWHWPLLAFQQYLSQDDSASVVIESRLWMVFFAIVLGYLSWRFIEQPTRHVTWKPKIIFTGWAATSAILIGLMVITEKTKGFEFRLPPLARYYLSFKKSKDLKFVDSSLDVEKPYIYGDSSLPARTVLWGDSHAYAIATEMGNVAKDHQQCFRYYGRPGSLPIVGINKNNGRDKMAYNSRVLEIIENDKSIAQVVLLGRWSSIIRGRTAGPAEMNELQSSYMITPAGLPYPSIEAAELAYTHYLTTTINRLLHAEKTVFLVYPIPEVGYDVPRTFATEVFKGRNPLDFKVSAKEIFWKRQKFVLDLFDSLPENPKLIRLKPHEILIHNGNLILCKNNELLYRDDDHLNDFGARMLHPLFEQVFQSDGSSPLSH